MYMSLIHEKNIPFLICFVLFCFLFVCLFVLFDDSPFKVINLKKYIYILILNIFNIHYTL